MTTNIHASCVMLNQKGILILGAPGQGKSDLCLRLIMDKGGVLVSDDRVDLKTAGGQVEASAPASIKGLLEVRGVGILTLPVVESCRINLVINLVREAEDVERLPEPSFYELGGVKIPQINLWPFEASAPDKVLAALSLL